MFSSIWDDAAVTAIIRRQISNFINDSYYSIFLILRTWKNDPASVHLIQRGNNLLRSSHQITSLQKVALDLYSIDIEAHTNASDILHFFHCDIFPGSSTSLGNDNIYPSSVCLMKYVEDFDFESKINVRNSGFSLSLCTEHSYQQPSHICFDEAIGGLACRDQKPFMQEMFNGNVAKQRDFYSYC